MAIELKMPALSPTMEEGTLAKWLVKEGDEVRSGDILDVGPAVGGAGGREPAPAEQVARQQFGHQAGVPGPVDRSRHQQDRRQTLLHHGKGDVVVDRGLDPVVLGEVLAAGPDVAKSKVLGQELTKSARPELAAARRVAR